jgi:hypothetical protein
MRRNRGNFEGSAPAGRREGRRGEGGGAAEKEKEREKGEYSKVQEEEGV